MFGRERRRSILREMVSVVRFNNYVFMCVGFYFSRGLRTCGSLTREITHSLVR